MNITNKKELINFLLDNRYTITEEEAFNLFKSCYPNKIQPIIWINNAGDSDPIGDLLMSLYYIDEPFSINQVYTGDSEKEEILNLLEKTIGTN